MIAHFKSDIINIMSGDHARGNWEELGLGKDIKQFNNAADTLINIVDMDKFIYSNHPNVELVTETRANQIIGELFVAIYSLKNEPLMNANLTQKIQNNEIDLNQMNPEWSNQEELEWLYINSISGIVKSLPPAPYLV